MPTLRETREQIAGDPRNWVIHLMDFVDALRRDRDPGMLAEPFAPGEERMDAMLAATAEQLCLELKMEIPQWIQRIPAVRDPWFVSGVENLKAIALAESPLPFRLRKLFVMENFLSRV